MKFTPFICLSITIQLSFFANCQQTDSSYLIYQKQFSELSRSRGISEDEITIVLERYSNNKISSNNEFAWLLGHFYSANNNIAVLLYFYNNDTLKEVLFEPGLVIEEKKVAITKTQLLQLCSDLNGALHLNQQAFNRSPKLRSSITPKKMFHQLSII